MIQAAYNKTASRQGSSVHGQVIAPDRGAACKHMNWHEYFTHDEETGNLIWKERPRLRFASNRGWRVWNGKNAGRIAGTMRPDGYVGICVNKKTSLAHIAIWNMHYGSIPDGMEIDHIDRNRSNNRLINLRLATRSQNAANVSKHRKNNTSGHKGVWWSSRERRWIAEIILNYKKIRIGSFVDIASASTAYDMMAAKIFGEYAKLNNDDNR